MKLEKRARQIVITSDLSSQVNKNFSTWIDIKQLHSFGIIRDETAEYFNKLRKYRNALVHGEPIEYIPSEIIDILEKTKNNFEIDITNWLNKNSLFNDN